MDRSGRAEQLSRRRSAAALALSAAAGLGACDAPNERPRASSAPSVAASAAKPEALLAPPLDTFHFAPWKSTRDDVQPVAPPESLLSTWRVFVNQERPRQKKNPQWMALPPREARLLPMAEDGRFRCLVTPLRVQARANEDESGVEAWVLTRSVRCSGDGWRTFTESPHQVVVTPDGKATPTIEQTDVLLRESIDGKVRETTIILRSDPDPDPPRAATGGR